ncbi:MAG: tRNA preQ1(34) S-adenosylmethionine ribosyltransferase-isomerase QueA [Armatimonadetes bacterium]|nr:tRNA preQ1(34) S-adenosylmethionine ribosyltransferase-isomerase QueA [Armatimonadota bacterium]
MRTELFDYPLPPERIAQTPIEPRDASRLLVLRRETGCIEHRAFRDLPEYARPGDLFVFNDTRVLPARLYGEKETGARVEALLLQRLGGGRWEALVSPGRRLPVGAEIAFGPQLRAVIEDRRPDGARQLRFETPDGGPEAVDEAIHRLGKVPLPPYIHTELSDPERYQTMFARVEGSAAAPTAALHFTPAVLDTLREKGARFAFVTLHIGIATFRPVRAAHIEEHEMHAEWYSLPPETVDAIRRCEGRVVAVGTTVVRCLESAAEGKEESRPVGMRAGSGLTNLYITPGHHFRVVDALLTNFHMPRSSLLVLVSAFAGREQILRTYQEALARGYRFLSLGDAMWVE